MTDDPTADSAATSADRKLVQALARVLQAEDMQVEGMARDEIAAKRREGWTAERQTYLRKARSILRKLEKKGVTLSATE